MPELNTYTECFKFPDGFDVMSSSGFVPLKTIQKTSPTETLKMKLENGKELICSLNH